MAMMIKLFLIPGIYILSCGTVKKNQPLANTDTPKITIPLDQPIKDSLSEKNSKGKTIDFRNDLTAIPVCIKNKIDSFKIAQKHEQPQRVVEYQYKGKKVYYIVMPCCDFFNEVYDEKCKFLGAPDGGFTGRGDGNLPDFFKDVTKEKIIWEVTK